MDDIKVSHVFSLFFTRMGDWLKKTYERMLTKGFDLI